MGIDPRKLQKQMLGALAQAQQCEQVGQRVFQATVKHQHLTADLLAPPPSSPDSMAKYLCNRSITGRYAETLPWETEEASKTFQPD